MPRLLSRVWRSAYAAALLQPGIDHLLLTSRSQGRDFRLTDVEGEVVTKLLA